MNAFLNPHNGTSLTGVIDVTAHSISLFQEYEEPKTINNILYLNLIFVSLNLMTYRLMNWVIMLLLCINFLVILMIQKLLV